MNKKSTYQTIKKFADEHNLPTESVTLNGGVKFLRENPMVLETVILSHLLNPLSRRVPQDVKEQKSEALYRLRYKKYNDQRELKKRECVWCGSTFTSKVPRVNACSTDCKTNHRRERQRINTINSRNNKTK